MSKVLRALKKTLSFDAEYDNFIFIVTVNQMTLDSTTEWNLEKVVLALINDNERITVKPAAFSVGNCAMWIVPVNLMTNVRIAKHWSPGHNPNDYKYWDRTLEIAIEDVEKNQVLASLHLNLKDYVRRGPKGHQEETLILESKHHEIHRATLWTTLHWKRVRDFMSQDYPSPSQSIDDTKHSTGSDTRLSGKRNRKEETGKWNRKEQHSSDTRLSGKRNRKEETGKWNRKEQHSESSHSYPQDDGNDDRSLNPYSSSKEDLDHQKRPHQADSSRGPLNLVEEESNQDEASADLKKTNSTTEASTSTTTQSREQRGSCRRYEWLMKKVGSKKNPKLPPALSQEEADRSSIASVDLEDPKYQRNWQEAVGFYPGEEEAEKNVEEEQKPIPSTTLFTEEEKELLEKVRSLPTVKVCRTCSSIVPQRQKLSTMSSILRVFGKTGSSFHIWHRKPKETASLGTM